MKTSFIFLFCLLCGVNLLSQQLEVDGDLLLSGKISGLSHPTDSHDVATKAYADLALDQERRLNAGLFGSVMDIDSNVYKTVKIGNQVWMAENLKTTRYNDETPILFLEDSLDWANTDSAAYCWYDNDSLTHAKLYGALYNFHVGSGTNSRNVCPVGWHVPLDSEWFELKDYLIQNGYGYHTGPDHIAKSLASKYHWNRSVDEGFIGYKAGLNNISGFSGLPGGERYESNFDQIGKSSTWWTSTTNGNAEGFFYNIHSSIEEFSSASIVYNVGISIRCLRD